MESHLFLDKEKNKEIKGRIVGGGNKQRTYTSKQEASSPTSHIESIFCTAVIDAMETRDVIKNGKAVKIIMVIRGRLADILIRTAPQVYDKYATTDKYGNTVNMYFNFDKFN